MKCDVGKQFRILRVVMGLAALGAGVYYRNWLGVLGFFPILSGVTGWCPVPDPFGLSKCDVTD